jgi:hypothetical protein
MNNTNPNREKNMEHDNREVIRPKTKFYEFEELERVVNSWIRASTETK